MRQAALDNILDLEWAMFSQVKSSRPVACQRSPDTFRSVRGSLFATWSYPMLNAYRRDLMAAREQGRNLLTEKYARMDGLIGPLTINPLIEIIVDIETDWQREMKEQYPALYRHCCRRTDLAEDGSDFSVYLHCELETYGDDTLDLYYENVKAATDEGRNLALDALKQLVIQAGYADLAQAEKVLSEDQRQRRSG
jgi:hypothetical protein